MIIWNHSKDVLKSWDKLHGLRTCPIHWKRESERIANFDLRMKASKDWRHFKLNLRKMEQTKIFVLFSLCSQENFLHCWQRSTKALALWRAASEAGTGADEFVKRNDWDSIAAAKQEKRKQTKQDKDQPSANNPYLLGRLVSTLKLRGWILASVQTEFLCWPCPILVH